MKFGNQHKKALADKVVNVHRFGVPGQSHLIVDYDTLPEEEKAKFRLATAKMLAFAGRGCGLGCGGCLLYVAIAFAIVVWACSGFPGLR